MSADLAPLLETVASAQRSMRRFAVVPLVPIVFVLVLPFPDGLPFLLVRVGFTALCVLIAGAMIWGTLAAPEKHPVIEALRDSSTVCWLFIEQTEEAHTGKKRAPALKIGLTSGASLVLPVDEGREAELLRVASQAAPRATLGWSAEIELRFMQQPSSLLQHGAGA